MQTDSCIWWLNILCHSDSVMQTSMHAFRQLNNYLWQSRQTRHLTNKSSRLDFSVRVCVRACVCVPFVSFLPLYPFAFLLWHEGCFLTVSPSAHFTIYFIFAFLPPPRSLIHYTSNLTFTPSALTSVYPPAVQISVLEKLIFISFLRSVLSAVQTVTCWTFNDAHFFMSLPPAHSRPLLYLCCM